MTQEIEPYHLELIEEEPFYTRLARWVKAAWCKLFGREGKTWNGKTEWKSARMWQPVEETGPYP